MIDIKPDNLKAIAQRRLNNLYEMQKECNKVIETAPRGYIRVQKVGSGAQYYLRTDPGDFKGTYIKKKDGIIAKEIMQRDYSIKFLDEIQREIMVLTDFINGYNPENMSLIFDSMPELRKRNVEPYYISDKDYVRNWLAEPFVPLDFEDGSPELFTSFGLKVRSKSEILIAEALHRHGIPFRYEYPLRLGNYGVYYPDFYCLNIKKRLEIPWEHLGMLDDSRYASRNVKKMEKYTMSGFVQGDNMIVSMETMDCPLDSRIVEIIIGKYFEE